MLNTARRRMNSSNQDLEVICHAAVKSKDGEIFIGKHHAECFHKGFDKKIKMSSKADDQGFVTNRNRFVDRQEGAKIALDSGQIDRKTTILFSEDLWSVEYNGKYNYDKEKGYVIKGNL